MPIPVFRPFIKRRDMDAVLTCLVSDNPGPGLESQGLVEDVSEILGTDDGFIFREEGRAIRTAIAVLDLVPGSRIAVSALAPVGLAKAIDDLGHVPVVVDTEESLPCLDLEALARIHAENPLQAIYAYCALGNAPDNEGLAAIGVPVIEDVSECFGETSGGLRAGTAAQVVVLSLETDGMITAGGGTLVSVRGKALAARLRQIAAELEQDVFLSDMNAALGRTQLRALPHFLERRTAFYEALSRAAMRGRHKLLKSSEIWLPFTCALLIETAVSEVQSYARKKNVETRQAFASSILDSWRSDEGFETRGFPNANALLMRCVQFPLFPGLSGKELETVERVVATLP